jgi:ubiquinone/menaquinone biosynthesis C-methylase UbiE
MVVADTMRKESERTFHNDRFGGEVDVRQALNRWYRAIASGYRMQFEAIRRASTGAKVLEFGCADGQLSLGENDLAQCARAFYGIDISDKAVTRARERASALGMEHCRFDVMDAEALSFSEGEFDLVFGCGIVHHLELRKCFQEIHRVLRSGGTAIFLEPMGHNPVLNWYRARTPEMRTPDEHPLRMADLKLAREFFSDVDLTFVGLATLLAVPFGAHVFGAKLMKLCERADQYLLRFPLLQRNAWFVLMKLTK